MMEKESVESDMVKEKYEGYIIDLVEAVVEAAGFDYILDERNSNYDSMIEALVNNVTDIVAAALTISEGRLDKIDFSIPFMSAGLTAIMKKPSLKDPFLFSFLSPFSLSVWLMILVAYITVSCLLAAISW